MRCDRRPTRCGPIKVGLVSAPYGEVNRGNVRVYSKEGTESGIKTKDELLKLSNKTSIKTFLIGESLLKNLDNNSIFSVL